ncbi:hypothetical protein OJAV_G00189020 [Oryzias javanicus]|uniref:EGF-like domain-containing protein n=1 Tax=Oryzias javanicus TaxID=123683 RepID=A0A3S2NY92_ORYJA|nr:hypothetical protein OJAV_G00189020 [Oryzias javanicus]
MVHVWCKEGYHGLRCDQFVPKTDAILSDPADELGIEFMESGDTYQRQVLSIFSIASGICLLGVACMALYRRNKRHREKLQAHFSSSRSLRDCSVNASGLMSKSTPRFQYSLHLQNGCGPHGSSVKVGNVTPGTSAATPPILSKALSKGKRFRSSSLSLSPALQRKEASHFRTPPIPRGKHKVPTNLMEGSRGSGHVYKHLQEEESTDVESVRRCDSAGGRVGVLLSRTSLSHFTARKGWTEVPCTRLDKDTTFLPPSLRTRSVPIIPSLQACDPDEGRQKISDWNRAGLIKWPPAPAGKPGLPISSFPSQPESVPPATAYAPTGSEENLSAAESTLISERKSLSCPKKVNGSHSAIPHGGPEAESGGNGVRNTAGAPHTSSGSRGLKAAGQREIQGQSQGQTPPSYGGENCFLAKGPSCRGTGNPPAS